MLVRVDGQWVVTRTRIDQLAPGDVAVSVDGVPMDEFYAQKRKYLAASNETARQRRLFNSPFLFPENFTLTLAGGKTVRVRRREQKLKEAAPRVTEGRELEPGIAYLRIPSFELAAEEAKAVEFVRQHAGARVLIVDVRGNGGGTTPGNLIRALMDRPYREITEASPMSFALFGAYRQVMTMLRPDQGTERDRGAMEALGAYSNPQLVTPGELKQPEKPLYTGKVLILTDNECASACEDFVMPFKVSRRGQILGQSTAGSTGQPFFFNFGNGMSFRVSTKRVFFPDGSQFEGVGVTPDVSLQPSPADMRAGTDVVLNKALELARTN
jgi:carboxyl-terminal processing protease